MRDIETLDGELRLVAALRRAARERGGPLPSMTWRMRCWMNACRADRVGYNPRVISQFSMWVTAEACTLLWTKRDRQVRDDALPAPIAVADALLDERRELIGSDWD